MVKKLIEPKSSKTVESRNLKFVEPNGSKLIEAKSSTKKMKKPATDPFEDHDMQIRDFCDICTKPPSKRPVFNQFNLPIETTTNTASCMVQSCYISVKHVEAVVNVPEASTEDVESLKAAIKMDSHHHKKQRHSRTSSQMIHDQQMQILLEVELEAEHRKKMEELMGFHKKRNIFFCFKFNNDECVSIHFWASVSG